jgi:hypothetical protein
LRKKPKFTTPNPHRLRPNKQAGERKRMAGPKPTSVDDKFGIKGRKTNCKLECDYPAVYVRYKDHVLFKNIQQPLTAGVERETVGWLTKQTSEIMLIEHGRTVPNTQIPSGQCNGVIVLKSCILEIRKLPLQKTSDCHLNSQETTNVAEYALQPKKRKTPNKQNWTGASKCRP